MKSPIYVEWVDSASLHDWCDVDEELAEGTFGKHLESIGYLVAETDDLIVITTTVDEKNSCDPLAIPKCAIVSRKTILLPS